MSEFSDKIPDHPFACLPRPFAGGGDYAAWSQDISDSSKKNGHVPDVRECEALWNKYEMFDNIRRHSRVVARICKKLAQRAMEKNIDVSVEECEAAGLLHDLAKSYCLRYGGSHGTLGSSWVLMETGNFAIAQGVLLHVHWPWELPRGREICCLPIFVIYADKRVMHDKCVTLDTRFDDLLNRYGQTAGARAGINATRKQALAMQSELSRQLDWDIDDIMFD